LNKTESQTLCLLFDAGHKAGKLSEELKHGIRWCSEPCHVASHQHTDLK